MAVKEKKEKVRANIERSLAEEFAGNFWKWRGGEFINFGHYGAAGVQPYVMFTIKGFVLKAEIQSQNEFNVPDCVRQFIGDNAVEECIEWTAAKLYELYKTVKERTEPYRMGYELYKKAWQGK